MAAPDAMPWYVAVPVALAATIAYFIIRHRQNKRENS